jgi:hypothetical protein
MWLRRAVCGRSLEKAWIRSRAVALEAQRAGYGIACRYWKYCNSTKARGEAFLIERLR